MDAPDLHRLAMDSKVQALDSTNKMQHASSADTLERFETTDTYSSSRPLTLTPAEVSSATLGHYHFENAEHMLQLVQLGDRQGRGQFPRPHRSFSDLVLGTASGQYVAFL